MAERSQPWPVDALFVASIAAAGLYGGWAATRGLALDQTILWQAGLRLLEGQRLYIDFDLPYGPLGPLVAAVLLWLTPTVGWAIVTGSALLNAAATAGAGVLVRRVTQDRVAGIAAALLTATWFVPVYGAIYVDTIAYAWVLGAMLAFAYADDRSGAALVAGLACAMAFHTKSSIGAPAVLAVALSVLAVRGPRAWASRRARWFIAGWWSGLLAVVAAIALSGRFSGYFEATFARPARFAAALGSWRPVEALAKALVLPFGIDPWQMIVDRGAGRLAFYPVVLVAYAAGAVVLRRHGPPRLRFVLACAWTTTLLCSALLGRHFTALFFGSGISFALALHAGAPARVRRWQAPATIGLVLLGLVTAHAEKTFWPARDPFAAETDLRPIALPPAAAASLRGLVGAVRSTTGAIVSFDERRGNLALLAARRAPAQSAVVLHDALTVPLGADRRAWEQDEVLRLTSRHVTLAITAPSLESGIRPLRAGMAVEPLPALDQALRSQLPAVVSDGRVFFRRATDEACTRGGP
jgi:hypothetical protein